MSISRQQTSERRPAVRGYAVTHPAGSAVLPIEPGWDQLLYAASGVMTVSTPGGSWVIPSHRALWIADGAPATVRNRDRAAALIDDPALALTALAARVGASRRTLERVFTTETGMTLGAWRRRARVLRALELLAAGTTVTATAAAVGYATPSSFVASFKQ